MFKLADLVTLFQRKVVQLGVGLPDDHATRLKEKLLFHIPQMRAYSKGRYILLAYDSDVGYTLAQTSKYSRAIGLSLTRSASLNTRGSLSTQAAFASLMYVTSSEKAILCKVIHVSYLGLFCKLGSLGQVGKAAELIRRDTLNNSRPSFTNAFLDGCLQQSVPPSLVAFVGMIEHGADIRSQLQQG